MNREQLIQSAGQISKVERSAAEEYAALCEKLVADVNERMTSRADINALVGKDNLAMMADNHNNHARFIASILSEFDPNVLVETVIWVFRAYQSRGFESNYWAAQLNAWAGAMKTHLSETSYSQIYPLYDWMIINIPIFTKISNEELAAMKED